MLHKKFKLDIISHNEQSNEQTQQINVWK